MGEATRDRQGSTSEPKKDKQKTQGWIRMHTDEDTRVSSVDEQKESEPQSHDRKARKLEMPIE
jgi:hypothetical protein